MILSTFRRLEPYRLHFFIAFFLSNAIYVWRSKDMPVEIVPGYPTPDSTPTYTPQQARDWYAALGDEGRTIYLQLCLLDVCILIPSYVFLLGAQLVATASSSIICYLPVMILPFDLIETLTHGCAVYGDWKPSSLHLVVATASTQFKYFGIGMAVLFVIYDGVHTYFQAPVQLLPSVPPPEAMKVD